MGNLHSVKNALDFIGEDSFVSDDPALLDAADGLILPGVGAFPDAMERLNDTGLTKYIKSAIDKKPLLGICLGMQLLFDRGYEFRECEGLGLIHGEVVKMKPDGLKVPHMGWNELTIVNSSHLLAGLPENAQVYFVHSYKAVVKNRQNLIASTDYGYEIPAIVQNGNVYGCQFHPEKSESIGLQILRNFGGIVHDYTASN
ncbi:MAG: imidazole glycerol phosphate synthase subunit HisH [Clostridia bacterium]|nr:imidazole glycerol phosphate synthase subunit HisH [Clostridia bacterium]